MPMRFVLEESRCIDMVSRVLSLVSKFSRKQAFIKIGKYSVTVIWKQNNSANIWAKVHDHNMFTSSPNLRRERDYIVILANPSTLGRLLKGAAQQGKKVTIIIYKDLNRLRVVIEPIRRDAVNSLRTVTHTLAATHQTSDACSALQLDELDNNYDTRAVINELCRIRHTMERFMALEPPRIYILSKQGGDLTFLSETQGSDINVSISDLENGFSPNEDERLMIEYNRREEAGVYVETKKIATFLTNCNFSKRAKVRFEVKHNKKLRLTIEHDKYEIVFVLPHNLN